MPLTKRQQEQTRRDNEVHGKPYTTWSGKHVPAKKPPQDSVCKCCLVMAKFTIREARRDDCEDILLLVKELANFENLPDGPKINADVLQRDGFDTPHPYFKCFVAELDPSQQKNDALLEHEATGGENKSGTGLLVGYALYFFTYSSWDGPSLYLEDIYVKNEYRSMGIGSALFDRVAQEAVEKGCCRLDFVVLNWNPATEFYKHKGAVDLTTAEGWHHYRLGTEALRHLAFLKKNTSASS